MVIHRNPSAHTGRVNVSTTLGDDLEVGWFRDDETDEPAVITLSGAGGNLGLHVTADALRNLISQLEIAATNVFPDGLVCLYCGDPHRDGPCRVVEAPA